eukprot:g16128.t1
MSNTEFEQIEGRPNPAVSVILPVPTDTKEAEKLWQVMEDLPSPDEVPQPVVSSRSGSSGGYVSEVNPEEDCVLFPVIARWEGDNWLAEIHGHLYKLPRTSRNWKMGTIRTLLGMRGLPPDEEKIFSERGVHFVASHPKAGRRMFVQLGGLPEKYAVGATGANGHFRCELRIREDAARTAPLRVTLVMPAHEKRVVENIVQFNPPQGLCVVSDLDDTIKVSNVLEKKILLKNTFARPYVAVPGTPTKQKKGSPSVDTAASRAAGGAGAAPPSPASPNSVSSVSFHYVTSSPWQLYESIWPWLEQEGFPRHNIHMRHLRFTDRSVLAFLGDPKAYKTSAVVKLLSAFPNRAFVLLGDSGERDADIYAELARQHPRQVRGIFIRAILPEHFQRQRYQASFAGLPASLWHIFSDPSQLPADVRLWVSKQPRLTPSASSSPPAAAAGSAAAVTRPPFPISTGSGTPSTAVSPSGTAAHPF